MLQMSGEGGGDGVKEEGREGKRGSGIHEWSEGERKGAGVTGQGGKGRGKERREERKDNGNRREKRRKDGKNE